MKAEAQKKKRNRPYKSDLYNESKKISTMKNDRKFKIVPIRIRLGEQFDLWEKVRVANGFPSMTKFIEYCVDEYIKDHS